MNVEIVAVGSELLLGQIVDTNSSWMGEQLAAVGINSHYQTKVGDNPARIREVLEQALDRSDAVICCGGLGPTQDDLTREVIAEVMGVELEFRQDLADRIAEMFARRGRTMPENNLRQAMVPAGATPLPQQPGTAPGLCCPLPWQPSTTGGNGAGERVIYAVPGVPYEMKEMVEGFILGDLVARSGEVAVIRSRVLRTWGTSESALAELLADRIEELDEIGNPTLAFLASGVEGLKVRITAKAADEAAAEAALDDEEQRLWPLIGQLVFARNDDNMEAVVVRRLAERGLTVAVAETVTGGYVASRLGLAPDAASVFRGGLVRGPAQLGDVAPSDEVWPDDPEQRAVALADDVRHRLGSDVGLAVADGVTPDDGTASSGSTIGLAVSAADGSVGASIQVPTDTERLRQFSAISLLDLLRRVLG